MLKSEIKILKEEYEAWKAELLYLQEELKLFDKDSNKAEIRDKMRAETIAELRSELIAEISSCRTKIYFLEDLAYKFCINEELGL